MSVSYTILSVLQNKLSRNKASLIIFGPNPFSTIYQNEEDDLS